jgi:hypothetical protein
MKNYHLYFYFLKFIILLLIALMSLKIINVNNKIYIIIDLIFKLSLGIFIIIFFSTNKNLNIDNHDRILIILSGFILILLIDYIKIINIILGKSV